MGRVTDCGYLVLTLPPLPPAPPLPAAPVPPPAAVVTTADLWHNWSTEFTTGLCHQRACGAPAGEKRFEITKRCGASTNLLLVRLARFVDRPAVHKNTTPVAIETDASVSIQGVDYFLVAVMFHTGSAINAGHWYAAVRRSTSTNQWCYCNDAIVSLLPSPWVMSPAQQSDAYALFYRKSSAVGETRYTEVDVAGVRYAYRLGNAVTLLPLPLPMRNPRFECWLNVASQVYRALRFEYRRPVVAHVGGLGAAVSAVDEE